MITEVAELVKVAAVFGPGGEVEPKWFLWRGRTYKIEKVTFAWKVKEGRATVHHFSVSTGTALYEICYHAETLQWRLMAVSPQ
jgi:hypothetical protein